MGTHARLPLAGEPRVSIVILAFRNRARLEGCLASIAANTSDAVPFETVVVANGASEEVRSALGTFEGIRVVDSGHNRGFAGGCNLGAEQSRGELLLLLNDDVEVRPDWLEALVRTADERPTAAAIGSRMTFTDGTLHEAGSIVWGDGSTTAVGRGLPGNTRHWRYLRQVDYCSAAALLVRTRDWHAVGGMDEGYYPGYCEDVDLCFALQEAGGQILYEPRSVICHHESSSFDKGLRDFLMHRNRARLRTKWADRLSGHEPDPGRPGAFERAIHRARGFPRRVLAVSDRLGKEEDWTRRLASELDLGRHSMVVALEEPAPEADAAPLEALGVEVVLDRPERHLARPELLYDVVILGPGAGSLEETVRRHQPHAAVVQADGDGVAEEAGSWQDAVTRALLARSAGRVPGPARGI